MRSLIFRNNNELVNRQDERDVWSLHSQINRIFDDFFHYPLASYNSERGISPRMNFAETEKDYEITVELPGMAEKDIEITYHDGTLAIKGEKKEEHEEKDKGYFLKERSYGAFQRSISLPGKINVEGIKAEFKKGVLGISVPKASEEEAQIKKISITGK